LNGGNMSIKKVLKSNKVVFKIWNVINEKRLKKIEEAKITGEYNFINRGNDSEKICIVLAGYKEFLWEDVFFRLKKFCPSDVDVCIVSSGVYSEKLENICEKNNWSYLSVKRNQISLTQNIAINLHKNAKFIYKLDEDIFVTKNFFNQLMDTYNKVLEEKKYKPGFVAPLININGYCYRRLLEKFNLLSSFEQKFGTAWYDACVDQKIIKNGDIAKYFWGDNEEIFRNIDALSAKLYDRKFEYSVCPIRFSIGAILFPRETWENMHKFSISDDPGLGADETEICAYTVTESRPIIVSENVLVGHFSYGPQTNDMKEYYKRNRNIFKLSERSNNG